MTVRTRYWTAIQEAATLFNLDPILVEAVVVQESAGNTDAFRFERDFWNRYLKMLSQYKDSNPRRVSSSYGLMQVMFQVAVEEGYDPTLAPELLFVPEIGLKFGCKRLRTLLDWADKGWPTLDADRRREAALASYNGGRGGNTPGTLLRTGGYARSVLAIYAQLLTEHGQ